MSNPLVLYDKARTALAAAKQVDEAKDIRDKAVAMQVYAKQAKDRTLVEDATDIRMRAERRAGELLAEMQKNKGAVAGKTGRKGQPVLDAKPKLSDFGVSKTQSSQWQALAALPQDKFESVVAETRSKMHRASRNALREAEIEQERAGYRARTEQGGTVSDLEALAAAGKRFGVICPDFPWAFETYSGKGKQRSADRRYDTWPLEPILAMAPLIRKLAADDCALLLWTVCPEQPGALELIKACGFEFKTVRILLAQDHAQCRDHRTQRQGAALGHGLRHKSQHRASVACSPGQTAAARRRRASGRHRADRRAQRKARRSLPAHRATLPRPLSRIVRAQAATELDVLGRRAAAARTRRVRWRVRGAPPGREQTKAGDL